MATITTNTFLDGGTARTAGETWVMNGGVLTIRTDTRWHANAPASMTGSLGNMTISATLGGGIFIDSSKVREVAYNTGGGVVPAIGTNITQGGVSGYLLGVYANLTSAPTAVGAAMPATGIIKFREVTGGSFAAGALTGITATATGADVTSWIEVVCDATQLTTVGRLGEVYTSAVSWYALGTTSGAANQTVQIPTNGGGAGTEVPAIWIETGVGTNVYEKYHTETAANMSTVKYGTDARSKVACTAGNGLVRIGHNGTTNVGFVPPAGCRIRVPNIFLRECATGTRATNSIPNATIASRPEFTTGTAGVVRLDGVLSQWWFNFSTPYNIVVKNSAVFDQIVILSQNLPVDLDNVCISPYNQALVSLSVSLCFGGGTINNCKVVRQDIATSGFACRLQGNEGLNVTNNDFIVSGYARVASNYTAYIDYCNNFTLSGNRSFNNSMAVLTCNNVTISNNDIVDRIVGTTNTTTPISGFVLGGGSNNCVVSGTTVGLNGTIANVQPYSQTISASFTINCSIINNGTRATPMQAGTVNVTGHMIADGGNNVNMSVKRNYISGMRLNTILTNNTSTGCTYENNYAPTTNIFNRALNTAMRGARGSAFLTSGQSSVYGTHWIDTFTSDTTGEIVAVMNEATSLSTDQVEIVTLGTGGGYTSAGNIVMPNLNDEIIMTMPYFALGYTAFRNLASTITGTNTGNFTYQYQIDTNNGSGWNGSWKTINGANLSAETLNSSLGVKLKIRIVCTVANANNAITCIQIPTSTTLVAQDTYYPLVSVNRTLTLTGLTAGTEIVLFDTSWNELDREVLAGSTYTYNYTWDSDTDDFDVNVLVWKDNKVPFKTLLTLTDVNQSVPLSQSDDLVYAAGSTAPVTINYASTLLVMNTGATELSVPEVYSKWKDDMRLTNNSQYAFAFTQLGGNVITGAIAVPDYAYLNCSGGWNIRPDEADHTLAVTDGILVSDNATDPFVDTLGAYTVRINYQQPVQALTVSTGGGGGATVADIWTYANRTLSAGGVTAIQSGLATSSELTSVQSSIEAEVNAIPTNPLLTSDVRLNNLDATVSSRLASSGYTAPANADITAIKAKTDTLVNTDLTGIATSAEIAALNDISASDVNTQVTNALNTYDAPTKAELDAVQTSIESDISVIPTNPLLTNDVRLNNIDATISSRLATSSYTAPANSDISAIKAKTDILVNTDLTGIATEANATANKVEIINEIESIPAGDAPTEAQMYAYFTTSNRQNAFKADVSNLATSAAISALNNISVSDVKEQADQAIVDADLVTKTDLDITEANITKDTGLIPAAL